MNITMKTSIRVRFVWTSNFLNIWICNKLVCYVSIIEYKVWRSLTNCNTLRKTEVILDDFENIDFWKPQRRTLLPNLENRDVSKCFHILGVKLIFRNCVRVLSEGFSPLFFIIKIQRPFSKGGSKKRKSDNVDKHGHGQKKRRPSTLCREEISKTI